MPLSSATILPSAANINVRDEIAAAPLSRFHIGLAALIALIVFFDGYDTFNAAYVIHYVMKPWGLRAGQAGFLVSSGLIGFMVGAIIQGKLADRFGRRVTLLLALWFATVFSFGTGWLAHSFLTFCSLRFLTGLGLGALLPLGVTYMNEFAPSRFLNSFSMWGWTFGFASGGTIASVVGILLTPKYGWQALYYLGSLSIFLVVACHFILPESIKFLALQDDRARVSKLLGKLIPARRPIYERPETVFYFPESNENAASFSLLLSPRHRRNTLLIWSSSFCILFALYGLTGWVPSAMERRGESFAASFGYGAIIQGMGFLGALVCGFLADRHLSWRRAMASWWGLGAVAVATLAMTNIHSLNLVCVAAAGFFILGGQGVLNNYTACTADTEVRATAVGMMLGVGRIGAILGPYILGLIQQVSPNPFTFFFAIAIAAALGVVTITFTQSAAAPRGLAALRSVPDAN